MAVRPVHALVLAALFAAAPAFAQTASTERVWALYTLGYGGPEDAWPGWSLNRSEGDYEGVIDPAQRAPGSDQRWRRHLKVGRPELYPLMGPADLTGGGERERETLRYHVRLARAAGIGAFIVRLGEDSIPLDSFEALVDVASSERFFIAILDDRMGLDRSGSRVETAARRAESFLKKYGGRAAWLRMEGKPVWLIRRLGGDASNQEMGDYLLRVGELAGPVWIGGYLNGNFEAGGETVMRATAAEPNAAREPDTSLSRAVAMRALFSPDPWFALRLSPVSLERMWRFYSLASRNAGLIAIASAAPGYDDDYWRGPPAHPVDWPAPTTPPSEDLFRAMVRAALRGDPDVLFLQSFNNWGDSSALEPCAMEERERQPCRYLRVLREELYEAGWVRSRRHHETPLPASAVDGLRRPFLPREILTARLDLLDGIHGDNLALGRPALARQAGLDVSPINDGATATSLTRAGEPEPIVIDFGGDRELTGLQLLGEASTPQLFEVAKSVDGPWKPVARIQPAQLNIEVDTPNAVARFLRWTPVAGGDNSAVIAISELEVYGEDIAVVEDPPPGDGGAPDSGAADIQPVMDADGFPPPWNTGGEPPPPPSRSGQDASLIADQVIPPPRGDCGCSFSQDRTSPPAAWRMLGMIAVLWGLRRGVFRRLAGNSGGWS
ncbi:MAG: hypothetical protein GMKNLPBB_03137 [Myxococcota bacterium]|nr:hypothetical protein [Myxococcota bacterium]